MTAIGFFSDKRIKSDVTAHTAKSDKTTRELNFEPCWQLTLQSERGFCIAAEDKKMKGIRADNNLKGNLRSQWLANYLMIASAKRRKKKH